MVNYEEKMLSALVKKYRESKKDSGTNTIVRRTKIQPTSLYRDYRRNDADISQIEAVNEAARHCAQMGFLTFESDKFSNEIGDIFLIDDKIDEIEDYLESAYGIESKASKRRYVEGVINDYSGISPSSDRECEKLKNTLDKNRIPQKYLQTEMLLKALVFIENNTEDMFLREASILIYGDSKYLEENTLRQVCSALRAVSDREMQSGEVEDEILEDYHIYREKRKICLKGNAVLRIGDREMDVGAFKDGMGFFTDDIERVEYVDIRAANFMTVENYTSWLRMRQQDTVIFYLGGYADRYQRDFLKKVYADNPDVNYLHFGDIDAGGMYIHEHLCRVTGIPFKMYRMSVAELVDERFKSCLHPLTEADRARLRSLAEKSEYGELASYMLENNVKLEQEIISYCDYGN
ncbi:MAG: DUF2220 domain-containing protein [Clostridiales bacterium]|nr:DUF2220 domain-containing protein [Clostridiales bacterium]